MTFFNYVIETLNKIKFNDWTFLIKGIHDGVQICVSFRAPDVNTKKDEQQFGRWWFIQGDATEDEIVRTAHKAIRCAMEHEVDEQFYYDGKRIFDPHKKVL